MIVQGATPPYCLNIQKRIGKKSDVRQLGRYGIPKFGLGAYNLGANNLFQQVLGIYQMRKTRRGKMPIKMKFYGRSAPTGAGQIAAQDKLRTAVSNWQGFTEAQKNVYRERAKNKKMFGFNLYIKEYILSN